jgi:hypothetical protein
MKLEFTDMVRAVRDAEKAIGVVDYQADRKAAKREGFQPFSVYSSGYGRRRSVY